MNKNQNEELGLARIIFFGILFCVIPLERLADYTLVPDWLQCDSLSTPWILVHLDFATAFALSVIANVSILTSAIGLFTSTSYWICFVSLSLLLLNWNKYCYTTHELTPIPIALLLWAMLDTASGYRIERKLFPKFFKCSNDFVSRQVLLYQKVHFCLVFFSAGLSKLLVSGLIWTQNPSLKNMLLLQNFLFENAWQLPSFHQANIWVIQRPLLCTTLATFALVLELAAPLALVGKKFILIVPSLLILQFGIFVLVYINFKTWIPIYVFWIPLGWINYHLKRLS